MPNEFDDMNGLVISGTPIAVDFWRIHELNGARIFFLSHFHADHMCQLTSSWRYPIYCSPITAKLLITFKKIPEKLVKPLEVDQSHVIALDDVSCETTTVTLVDAHHCPGAVMFLFQGYFGNVLYTGDFRYDDPAMLTHPVFLEGRLHIDRLFMDNTYCSPAFASFPSRQVATEQLIKLVSSNLDAEVFIGMRKLGKESLLVDLARTLKSRIVVSPEVYEKMEILDYPDVFTTEVGASRITAVPFHEVTPQRCRRYLQPGSGQALFILPTCLFRNGSGGGQPKEWPPGVSVKIIDYSDHSSFDELLAFVARVRPSCVNPIVALGKTSDSDRAGPPTDNSPSVFDHLLSELQPSTFKIPHTVKSFMNRTLARPCRTLRHTGTQKVATPRSASRGVVFFDEPDLSPVKIPKMTLLRKTSASYSDQEDSSKSVGGGGDRESVERNVRRDTVVCPPHAISTDGYHIDIAVTKSITLGENHSQSPTGEEQVGKKLIDYKRCNDSKFSPLTRHVATIFQAVAHHTSPAAADTNLAKNIPSPFPVKRALDIVVVRSPRSGLRKPNRSPIGYSSRRQPLTIKNFFQPVSPRNKQPVRHLSNCALDTPKDSASGTEETIVSASTHTVTRDTSTTSNSNLQPPEVSQTERQASPPPEDHSYAAGRSFSQSTLESHCSSEKNLDMVGAWMEILQSPVHASHSVSVPVASAAPLRALASSTCGEEVILEAVAAATSSKPSQSVVRTGKPCGKSAPSSPPPLLSGLDIKLDANAGRWLVRLPDICNTALRVTSSSSVPVASTRVTNGPHSEHRFRREPHCNPRLDYNESGSETDSEIEEIVSHVAFAIRIPVSPTPDGRVEIPAAKVVVSKSAASSSTSELPSSSVVTAGGRSQPPSPRQLKQRRVRKPNPNAGQWLQKIPVLGDVSSTTSSNDTTADRCKRSKPGPKTKSFDERMQLCSPAEKRIVFGTDSDVQHVGPNGLVVDCDCGPDRQDAANWVHVWWHKNQKLYQHHVVVGVGI